MSDIDPFLVFRIPPAGRRALPAYGRDELQKFKQLAVEGGFEVPRNLALDASNILMDAEQLRNYCLCHMPALVPAEVQVKAPVVTIAEGNAADQEYTQVDVEYVKRKGKKEHPPVVNDRPLLAPLFDKGRRKYPFTGQEDGPHALQEWIKKSHERGLAVYPQGTFLHFVRQGMEGSAVSDTVKEDMGDQSWKLHVTTRHYFAVEKLVELAVHFKLPHFKVSNYRNYEYFSKPGFKQAGKTAVFYHYQYDSDGKEIDWKAFATLAEAIVLNYGGPGPQVSRDKPIPGASTIFRRCDLDLEGAYLPRDEVTNYLELNSISDSWGFNVAKRPDPWDSLEIEQFNLEDVRRWTQEAREEHKARRSKP